MSDEPAHKGGRKTQAGVAGAGGGTLLTALVQLLDDNNPWKKLFLLAVPTVSVGISVCWFFCIDQVKQWWTDYNYARRVKRLHELTNKKLYDKDTTPEEKEQVRKKLQDFEISEIDNLIVEVKSLKIAQKAWPRNDEKRA
jgi:hypothetical protein